MVEMGEPVRPDAFPAAWQVQCYEYAAWERQRGSAQVCSGMQMRTKHCMSGEPLYGNFSRRARA